MNKTSYWNLQGDYFETCNCVTACPCVWLQPPTEGNCKLMSFVSEILGVKKVKIDYQVQGDKRRLSIPDIAQAEIESIQGIGGGEATIENPPLCVVQAIPLLWRVPMIININIKIMIRNGNLRTVTAIIRLLVISPDSSSGDF